MPILRMIYWEHVSGIPVAVSGGDGVLASSFSIVNHALLLNSNEEFLTGVRVLA